MAGGTVDVERRARWHAALGDPHRLAIADTLALGDRTPKELGERLDLPGNLLAHHLRVLEGVGLVERRVSQGDARRRYVVLRPPPAGPPVTAVEPTGLRPLFVCTRNSARSQLAAAVWRERTGRPATSAGRHPAGAVHPLAIRVAAEAGLDLSRERPAGYPDTTGRHPLVVSVCDRTAEDRIPPAERHLHWSVPDPVPVGTLRAFRTTLIEITHRVATLASGARTLEGDRP